MIALLVAWLSSVAHVSSVAVHGVFCIRQTVGAEEGAETTAPGSHLLPLAPMRRDVARALAQEHWSEATTSVLAVCPPLLPLPLCVPQPNACPLLPLSLVVSCLIHRITFNDTTGHGKHGTHGPV